MRQWLRLGSPAAALAALTLACVAPIAGHIPARTPKSGTGQLRAGAAKVDLTPIPGIPIGGYSIEGKISRGVWTRLYARAIYIEDASGRPLALVSCDLMIMPEGLSDRVAQLVQTDPQLRHVGRENLLIAATETHQGPGNHFDSPMYNGFSSPRANFDPELFEFLAQRIKQAVAQAAGAAQPAVMHVNHVADANANDNRLDKFFRNRSFAPFLSDPEAARYLIGNATLSPCPKPFADPEECRAVNPLVESLSFHELANPTRTLAVAAFLAAHTTVLTSETEVYSSDLFGASAQLAETAQVAPCASQIPVVALFNGAQGDVTTTWEQRDRGDVLRLAEKLAGAICSLLPGTPQSGVAISYQYAVEKLANRKFQSAQDRPPKFERSTAPDAATGAAELGGAEDGRTLFYKLGFEEGYRNYVRREHGMKLQPGEIELGRSGLSLAGAAFEMSPPPSEVPLGVWRIGDVALVGVPGEATTVMGDRIRESVLAGSGNPKPARVLLVGFANGHISYLTTPEEYDFQHYEGASNYYGAGTAPFLADRLGEMSVEMPAQSTAPFARTYAYDPGASEVFAATDVGSAPWFVDDGLSAIVQDKLAHRPKRDFPTFCWYDALPRLKGLAEGTSDCKRSIPDVSIREAGTNATLSVGGALQDNHGLDVVTLLASFERSRGEWCAIWLQPTGADPSRKYEFHVERIRGVSVTSNAFTPAATPPFPYRPASAALDPVAGMACSWLEQQLGLCFDTCQDVPPL